MTGAFHPWRAIRALPHVEVQWTRLPRKRGDTDGRRVIRIHPDQLQVERRVVAAHEGVHVEWDHDEGCTEAEEQAVRAEAARRLIPIQDLLDVLRWAPDWLQAADELWVTVEVFQDRLDALSEVERRMVADLAKEIEGGC